MFAVTLISEDGYSFHVHRADLNAHSGKFAAADYDIQYSMIPYNQNVVSPFVRFILTGKFDRIADTIKLYEMAKEYQCLAMMNAVVDIAISEYPDADLVKKVRTAQISVLHRHPWLLYLISDWMIKPECVHGVAVAHDILDSVKNNPGRYQSPELMLSLANNPVYRPKVFKVAAAIAKCDALMSNRISRMRLQLKEKKLKHLMNKVIESNGAEFGPIIFFLEKEN